MLLFGYCRVSSEEQAQHGISISAQKDILSGYAAMSQAPIRVYEDAGFSGKNMERPALRQMLADLKSDEDASAIVVWKLDRLSRSLRDTLTMIEDLFQPRGIRLVSITESIDTSTPSGRMMLNMMASFAQLEREQDSDRVVMAHKHLARDCKYLGGHIPIGYVVDETRHFALDPVAAPVIRRVFEMYLAHEGYSKILAFLNSELPGHPSRKTPFKKPDLKYLLHNEFYAGVYIRRMGMSKGSRVTSPELIRVPGGVPAIITSDEWRLVEMIRDENKNNHTTALYRAQRVYPLAGLVYCAVCGKPMYLNHGGKDRNGTVQRYYECRSGCVRPSRLEKTEASVYEAIDYLLSNEDSLIRSCEIANGYSSAAEEDKAADALRIEEQKQRVKDETARLIGFIKEQGEDAPASILSELKALDKQSEDLDAQLAALARPVCFYDAQATIALLRAAQQSKNKTPEEQKQALQAAVHRVLISDTEIQIQPAWTGVSGDEGNRTPVRRSVNKNFSERSPCFGFPVQTVRGQAV